MVMSLLTAPSARRLSRTTPRLTSDRQVATSRRCTASRALSRGDLLFGRWGETITAAWSVGPSVHPEPARSESDHAHGQGDPGGSEDAAVDPVCGMHVDRGAAVAKGLHRQHAATDYYFCAKGCYLDFGDDPERYLDPSFVPSM